MSVSPGSRVGPYEISSSVGAGAMGEVYRARDTRLNRDVAIKVLPSRFAGEEHALERFGREARVIASLNHPHICTLFDIGEHDGQPYLVMELLEGGTLYARMGQKAVPPAQAVEWAIQLADALDAAHERGIVHRDLKPSNIIITARGDLKVLDFGIAKLADDSWASARTTAALTASGVSIGTAPYMAPEQIRGEAVDERSDLFALGLVIYEIATGTHPFAAATTGMVTDGILHRTAAPPRSVVPGLPKYFDLVVEKLLEKDRGLRYQHASEARADLKRAQRELEGGTAPERRAPAAAQKSVAVLPFRNLSNDPDNAFFGDGIAEDLIDALGRVDGLRVASRASAFRFRDDAYSPDAVGAALGVGAIVDGSVRRAGPKLRAAATLIDAQTGYQMWSEKYDREMADVFDIQDDIVSSLVSALAPALLGHAKEAVRRPTENLEAYEWYLKGRYYWHQRSPTTLKLAIQSFEHAIALDDRYALAYAGLADSWALYRPYGWLPVEACKPHAERAVSRAYALAPNLAEVQFSKAFYTFYFEKHWRAAEPYFRKSIELNSRWSLSRAYFGVFLSGLYRADEGEAEAARAIELDPLSPFIHGVAGMAAFSGGHVPGAEHAARRALELQPDFLMGTWLLAFALYEQGRLDEADRMMAQATAISRAPIFVGKVGKIYARQGRLEDCARIEAELEDRRSRGEYIPRACDVMLAVGRDDVAALRRALQACIDEDTSWFTVRMGAGPGLETYRSDPGVNALLNELYDLPSTFRRFLK